MAGNGRGKVLGTSSKYDRGLSVLEQYDLVSEEAYRGRGTLLCQTQQGLKMIKPYTGSVKRLEKINLILEHLQKAGHGHLDLVLRNKEGSLISTDKDGYTYLVKNWWEARECDVRSESDILRCMKRMARMHKDMQVSGEDAALLALELGECEMENLLTEYEKHNQQLKKIRDYIRRRKQKNAFEYQYLNSVGRYLEYGIAAHGRLKQIGYDKQRSQDIKEGKICHGLCNQHNFLLSKDQETLVNFDHFFIGNHMTDVAQLLRKIMEKHNWDMELAHRMLETYDHIYGITDQQWKQLGIRMAYPEKYWKIANFYYNNNKAFLPEKNVDKLNVFILQERKWLAFLEAVFP